MPETLEILRTFSNTLQAVGLFGFLLYVGTFAAIQTGYLCGNGIMFSTLQVAAATCVLVSLIGAFNLASFLIQINYIGIGIIGIVIRWHRGQRKMQLFKNREYATACLSPEYLNDRTVGIDYPMAEVSKPVQTTCCGTTALDAR